VNSYTVTITDQHSHQLQYLGVLAYNKQTAFWLVASTQLVQSQMSAVLTMTDTITITVA